MKKSIILFCLVLLLVPGCGKEPTIAPTGSEYERRASTFDELVEVSDLIIKVKVLPGKKNVPDTVEVCGHTITKLKVLETFKGDIAPGEIVTITEFYYRDEDYIWIDANYLPAKEKQEYIFFLTEYHADSYWSGMYYPTDMERGKYPLKRLILDNLASMRSLSNEDLELWTEPADIYRRWYKQVIEKYYPNH